ncbi:MAG: four helix bundle protein [Phycisphaerae bacterium]|jgi:four helix bundle protein
MPVKDYRELEIWKRGISLVEDIYAITRSFPKEETYGLTGQIRRSAVSIPSNIAEGFARSNNNEYKQFLYYSLGSCSEATTQVIIASRLKYVAEKQADELVDKLTVLSKMIMSLIKKLKISNQ